MPWQEAVDAAKQLPAGHAYWPYTLLVAACCLYDAGNFKLAAHAAARAAALFQGLSVQRCQKDLGEAPMVLQGQSYHVLAACLLCAEETETARSAAMLVSCLCKGALL